MAENDIGQLSAAIDRLYEQGATNEEVREFLWTSGVTDFDSFKGMLQQYRQDEQAKRVAYSAPQGALQSFAQGSSFGFVDELGGGVDALIRKYVEGDPASLAQLYDESAADRRQALAGYVKQNPKQALAAQVAGGLSMGVGAARLVKPAGTGLRRVAQATALGALGGGVAGAGAAEPGQTVEGAASGAITGAALGFGVSGAMEGAVAPLARYVQTQLGALPNVAQSPFPPAGQVVGPGAGALPAAVGAAPGAGAMGRILQGLERDQDTPAAWAQRTAEARAAGVPATPYDTARDATQGLARGVALQPGAAQRIASQALVQKNSGTASGPQVVGAMERATQQGVQNSDQLLDVGRHQYRVQARQDYSPQVLDAPVMSPSTAGILNGSPTLRASWTRVADQLRGLGEPVRPLFDESGRVIRAITVRDADWIKKGLDKDLYDAQRGFVMDSATSDKKLVLGPMERVRRDWLDAVDRSGAGGSAYAAARSNTADWMEVQRALEDGQQALTQSPRQIQAALAGLSPEARDAYRAAALDAYRLKVGDAVGQFSHPDLVTRTFGFDGGTGQARFSAIFGDQATDAFRGFANAKRAEGEGFRRIFTGSRTAVVQREMADANDLDGVVLDVAAGNKAGLARRTYESVARRFTEARNTEIAQGMFTGDPDDFYAALERARVARETEMRRAVGTNVTAGAGAGLLGM